jgi:hypothetical protein
MSAAAAFLLDHVLSSEKQTTFGKMAVGIAVTDALTRLPELDIVYIQDSKPRPIPWRRPL